MPSRKQIPEHRLSTPARNGVLVIDMAQYDQYDNHPVREPHRDDHFTIIVLQAGKLELTVDFNPVVIADPAFLLIMPEQIHQLVSMSNVSGWLINIDKGALSNDLLLHIMDHLNEPVPLTTAVTSLLTVAVDLGTHNGNTFIEKAIQLIVETVITIALSDSTTVPKEGRSTFIYRQFKTILEQHYKEWKQASDYATAMTISASHLNDTVKNVSGASISSHIQERNILEAKRLLYNTTLTASEIGFALGYEDPVYFGKLFKKHTGITPLGFRARFRE